MANELLDRCSVDPNRPKERVLLVVFVLSEGVGVQGRPSASADSYIKKIKVKEFFAHIYLHSCLPCHDIIRHSVCDTFHSWSYPWYNQAENRRRSLHFYCLPTVPHTAIRL